MLYKLPHFRCLILIIGLFIISQTTPVFAVTTLAGNRIVIDKGKTIKEIEIRNDSDDYVLLHTFITDMQGNNEQKLFNIIPPIFKLGPKSRQKLRVVVTNPTLLSKDKETLYYFHYQEIPSVPSVPSAASRIAISVDNVVKLIYRPKTIDINPGKIHEKLTITLENKHGKNYLVITNPTATYFSVIGVEVNEKNFDVPKNSIIEPYGKTEFVAPTNLLKNQNTVQIKTINDFGGTSTLQLTL